MDNPFRKRATEFLREDEAFLAIVTPEPIQYFLSEPGKQGRLYDRLVLLRGTPGSGKTTLARLFEFPTFHTLVQNKNFEGHKDISAALVSCEAMQEELPQLLGFRLPLETGYRDFWEFGYSEDLKTNLMIAMLQARAVLGWFRHLAAAGIEAGNVTIITRPEASGVVGTIGGTGGEGVRTKARTVEHAIYQVMNALVAPQESQLPGEAVDAYRPFDIIDRIAIRYPPSSGLPITLRPLAIFDDAHVLHPAQFRALEKFLLRRELRVARWMIARFDILLPQEALAAVSEEAAAPARFAGISADREAEVILLQSTRDRLAHRIRFRKMSKDMAGRYLRRMPLLNERGLVNLGNLLGNTEVSVGSSALEVIRRKVNATQRRLKISPADCQRFTAQISEFSKADSEEVALYMLKIMMHRFDKRRSRRSPGLFDSDGDQSDAEIQVAANDSVYAAALFHLFHEHARPYYYGIDSLCDTSSENAEQFLQLAAELVEAVVTQLARGKSVVLRPAQQHSLLRRRGERIMEGWRFPHDDKVTALVKQVAQRCLRKSLEANGAVIANAIGIPQDEFPSLSTDYPELAAVLQFAIAYNAISLVPNHPCKSQMWCLFELGGMVQLRYGLTSRRGGFVESTAAEVSTLLREQRQ